MQQVGVCLLFGAMFILLSACDSGGQMASEADRSGQLPPDLLKTLLADAGDEQRKMLEDGVLTFAEYESAIFAKIACLKEAGAEVGEPELRYGGRYYRFDVSVKAEPGDFGPMERVQRRCYEPWRVIEDAWYVVNQPTEEDLQNARQALIRCLLSAGVEVGKSPTSADFDRLARQASSEFIQCSTAVSEEYGLVGFVGF